MANAKNKVKYEVTAAYFAPVTESDDGAISYDTPFREPGIVSLSLSAEGDINEFLADGGVYIYTSDNQGYSGDLEFALLSDQFREKILKEEKTEDGVYIESKDELPVPFALLAEFRGDKHKIRHVFYYCMAARPAVSGENSNKKSPSTDKISIKCGPSPATGRVKARTSADTGADVYGSFFSNVYQPSSL